MVLRWPILLAAVFSSGCSAQSIKAQSGNLTQDQANDITAKCGGDKEMVLVKDGELILTQAKNFAVTSCIMKSLDAIGVTDFTGSVSNEKH